MVFPTRLPRDGAAFPQFAKNPAESQKPGSDIRPRGLISRAVASFVADDQESKCPAEVFRAVENFTQHVYLLSTYREGLATNPREIALISPQIASPAGISEAPFHHAFAPFRTTESQAA
jgi:hypothetical protein